MAHPTAPTARAIIMMSGRGELTKRMLSADTTPRSDRVTRSPRQAAIGGAMLSGEVDRRLSVCTSKQLILTTYRDLIRTFGKALQGYT